MAVFKFQATGCLKKSACPLTHIQDKSYNEDTYFSLVSGGD